MRRSPVRGSHTDNQNDPGAMAQERSIFRAHAEQNYLSNQDKVVFPRLVSKSLFLVLWIIALALFLLGSLITFWPLIEPFLWR